MSRSKKNFRTYTVALVANQESGFGVDGNMYAVIESTNEFTLTLDDSNRLAKQVAGMGGVFESEYNKVTLLSAVNQTVTLILGYGTFLDARATLTATINSVVGAANTLDTGGDVSLAPGTTAGLTSTIRAADASALTVIVKAAVTNTETVRVGGTGTGAGQGYPLDPGESVSLSTTAEIAGYNPSNTTAQTVSVLPVRGV